MVNVMHRIRQVLLLLSALILLGSTSVVQAADQNSPGASADELDTVSANVVVFAYFTDDTQESADTYFNSKYASFKDCFVGNGGRSFVNYLNTVSYGKWRVNVCFPQESADQSISAIPLGISQSEAKNGNVDAQILSAVLANMPELESQVVDRDHDGEIDNLTVICKAEDCGSLQTGASLVSHANTQPGSGSRYSYNSYVILNTESLSSSLSGLAIHEYLHTLGYPDLYNSSGEYPVYIWDIMGSVSSMPSYPLAFLRSAISGWMSIKTITADGTYTLCAQDAASGDRAFILQSPINDEEFFVVEFRKRGAMTDSNSLDRMLQGSGLIVYRVAPKAETDTISKYTNKGETPAVYVFRPQDSSKSVLANAVQAFLSQESGRTSLGVTELDATEADGAIVFSDGSNSGIVISEIGSASGDTISFKVSFTKEADNAWTSVGSVGTEGTTIDGNAACEAANGNLYLVRNNTRGGSSSVYAVTASGLSKLCSGPSGTIMSAACYNGKLYIAFADSSYNGKVAVVDLTTYGLTTYSVGRSINEMCIEAAGDGVLVAYSAEGSSWSGQHIYTRKVAESGLGSEIQAERDESKYPTSIDLAYAGDTLFMVYREAFGNDAIVLSRFTGSAWEVVNTALSGDCYDLDADGTALQLSTVSGGTLTYYLYNSASAAWTEKGSTALGTDVLSHVSVTTGARGTFIAVSCSGSGTQLYRVTAGGIAKYGEKVTVSGGDNYLKAFAPGASIFTLFDLNGKLVVKSCPAPAAQGHTHSYMAVVTAPTCTAGGYTTYTCSCGDTYTADAVAATGHTTVNDAATAPTCTTAGKTVGTHCSVCYVVLTVQETVPATGHSYSAWTTTKAASCTEDGSQKRICTTCGAEETKTITTLGHRWDTEYTIDKEATCTEAGSRSIHCSRCNETKAAEAIPAMGHTIVNDVAVEPTCTSAGKTAGTHCSVCHAVLTLQETVPATGHSFTNYAPNNDATCTADGTKTAKCDRCEETDTVTDTSSKLGHSFTNYVSNNDATCTADGTKTAKCDRCEETDTFADAESALGHDHQSAVTTAATCTEPGVKTFTCSRCDDSYTETIPATGHSYQSVVTEPTCTADGYTTHTCGVCGDTYTDNETEATGHSFGEWETVAAQSCTNKGGKKRICGVCGYTETSDVDANGHSWADDYTVDVEATCTTEGSRSIHCANCEAVKDSTVIEALGHSFTNYVSNSDATCTTDGTKTAKCDRCEETDTVTDTGSKPGHSFTNYKSNNDATCTADGTKTATCDRCEETDTVADTGSKLGHSFTNYVSNNDATCTADGTKTATCDRCEATDTVAEAGTALGHDHHSAVTTAATCTEPGVKTFTCSRCDDSYTEEIPATGHSHQAVVTEPTCTADGYTTHTCSVCGNTYTDTPTAATGHSYNSGVITTAATCTAAGVKTFTCANCGAAYTEGIAATGHSYTDVVTEPTTAQQGYTTHTCTICGDNYVDSYTDPIVEVKTGWQKTDGKWYYYNADGSLATSKWIKSGTKWYYVGSDGVMATSKWIKTGTKWYYVGSAGVMATSKWIKTGTKWYYVGTDGVMATSKWIKSSGKWYYVGSDGVMATSKWIQSGDKWYYVKSSGVMAASESIKIGTKTYSFDANGVCTNP